jgi:hypothetical protein
MLNEPDPIERLRIKYRGKPVYAIMIPDESTGLTINLSTLFIDQIQPVEELNLSNFEQAFILLPDFYLTDGESVWNILTQTLMKPG